MKILNEFNKLDKYTKLTIITIIIGSILRLALATYYPISSDTAWHLSVARFIAETGKVPVFESLGRPAFSYPYLFHILAALIYKTFIFLGEDIANRSMNFISPIFSTLSLVLTFLITKKITTKKITFYAVLFSTFIPVHFFHSYVPFLGITFAFFILLSIYLALNNRWILAAIALGLSNNVRIYGLFILPLLLYILYDQLKSKEEFIKKAAICILIVLIIASPVFITNYLNFKNPVWPGMGYIFKDGVTSPWTEDITQSPFRPVGLYWGFYGIPNENPANFFQLNIPYLQYFFYIWFIATLIFTIPFIVGLWTKKRNPWILSLWSLGVLIPMILIELQVRAVPRHFLPLIPVFGIIWGTGIITITKKLNNKHLKAIFMLVLIFIMCGFTIGEITKTVVAKSWWDEYENDFNWVKENTPKTAQIHYPCQTLSYHVHRLTPLDTDFKKGNYIWVNDDYKLEPCGIWPKETSNIIKNNYKLIYYNNETKTQIYNVI